MLIIINYHRAPGVCKKLILSSKRPPRKKKSSHRKTRKVWIKYQNSSLNESSRVIFIQIKIKKKKKIIIY